MDTQYNHQKQAANYALVIIIGIVSISGIFISMLSTNETLVRLGFALITSGIVSILFQVLLRKSFIAELNRLISPALDINKIESLSHIHKAGLVAVHPELPSDKVSGLISRAQNNVQILQTWIPNSQRLRNPLVQAAKNGATIQILICSQHAPFTRQRSAELGYTDEPNYGEDAVSATIINCDVLKRQGITLTYRTYDVIPSMQLYIIDDRAFVGLFWHGEPSESSPNLEIIVGENVLGSSIKKEFEKMWEVGTDPDRAVDVPE